MEQFTFPLFCVCVHAKDCTETSVSVSKQRTGSIGDRPAKPTLLEQVLNQKRLVSAMINLWKAALWDEYTSKMG